MEQIIMNIRYYLDNVEMNQLDGQLKKDFRERFNCSVNFEYGLTSNQDFIIKTSENGFKNLEYYYGLEYEREDIILQIRVEEEVITVYEANNSRLIELFEYLMPDIFCDDEEVI